MRVELHPASEWPSRAFKTGVAVAMVPFVAVALFLVGVGLGIYLGCKAVLERL